MRVLLTNAMGDELLNNEDQIKNQLGAYRPHYDPVTKSYLPVIKCWPLEDFKGEFNQEREVIPGMEEEVYDIALATIEDNEIVYKFSDYKWVKSTLDNYSILIYTPEFDNNTIFLTENSLPQLFDELKRYQIVSDKDLTIDGDDWEKFFVENIDKWFSPRFQGICTYILLGGDGILQAGKYDNKKEW